MTDSPVTGRSEDLVYRADDVLAYGGHHKLLLRPLYEGEGAVFPHFAERAEGYRIVDADGRTYIDWVSGWGPVLLGYAHPAVEDAIRKQLDAGPLMSLSHRVEVDVATALTEMVPCAEMVAFGKNGSDVLTAAVRIARAATGRDVILHHGFHGFHDWYVAGYTNALGTPDVLRPLLHAFPYNDLASVQALIEAHRSRVAAVVMEPTTTLEPEQGYLEGVRDLTTRNGALLIFDEMFTGLRLARGGAEECFGVRPDLTCFGKGLANGMPLAAVMGASRYMRYLPHVAYGMTYRGETLSLAAAQAVLRVVREEPVVEHLSEVGDRLRRGFAEIAVEEGVPCGLIGPNARMAFEFDDFEGHQGDQLGALFVQECAAAGILISGSVLPSYAHDEEALADTLKGLRAALRSVKEIALARDGEASARLRFLSAKGFIEAMRERDGELRVAGWLAVENSPAELIELMAPSGKGVVASRVERPDIAATYPHLRDGAKSGYEAILPRAVFFDGRRWSFDLIALTGSEPVFRCQVSRAVGKPPLDRPYSLTGGPLYL